jgi:hypothetical protein
VTHVTPTSEGLADHSAVRSKTVLVIDGDKSVRQLLAAALPELVGVRLVVAADGREGIEIAREERPDLVLLDLRLPGLDGLAVLTWLRSSPRTRTIPAVVITAQSEAVARSALAMGRVEYLRKPFDLYELAACVGRWLSQGRERPG